MRHKGLLAQLPLSSELPSGHCPRICGIALSEKGPPWQVHLPVQAPSTPQHSPVTPGRAAEGTQPLESCLIPGFHFWALDIWDGAVLPGCKQVHFTCLKTHAMGKEQGLRSLVTRPGRALQEMFGHGMFQFFAFLGRRQGPFEAFSFWMDKMRLPSLDASSAEEMAVGGSWNESLDRQWAGATSLVLNPELFTITKVSPSRRPCQAQRAG